MTLITCKDLGFSYDGQPAVRGISCIIDEGDYLCVVGCNGSGKTTFVKGLLGLLKAYEGAMEFDKDLRLPNIGYLPQQVFIQKSFPAIVLEIVLSGRLSNLGLAPFYGKADKSAAKESLELLDIAALSKASFSSLSSGQQQRVLLARAICSAPDGLKLLILDEPMNGLDPHVMQDLYALIDDLNKRLGIAIIMVTHDVQASVRYASHILALEGTQQFFGTAHEFEHTAVGQELMRDSCGGNCRVCGIWIEDNPWMS